MVRQDRQGVRTATDIERKYDLSSIVGMKQAIKVSEDSITKTNTILENFVNSTLKAIDLLQEQVDGNITTWFSSGEPTLSNTPASGWTTDEQKNEHLGDLYYDSDTGYAYRFTFINDEFSWLRLSDNDIAEALALANAAKDTADGKRRVFTTVPIPPYDCGDLWVQDEDNGKELYVCQIAKAEGGTYEEIDFIVATKYTDDTYALLVGNGLESLGKTVSELSVGIDGIESRVERTEGDIAGLGTRVTQTEDNITQNVSTFTEMYNTIDGEFKQYKAQVDTYMRLTSEGVEIGRQIDGIKVPYSVLITNESIYFKHESDRVAWISNSKLYIKQAEVATRFSIGGEAEDGSTTNGTLDFISTSSGVGIKWR